MNTGQLPSNEASKHRAGPQGTQLLSAAELQRFAREEEAASDGRPTTHEPVLEGVSEGLRGRRFILRSGRQTIGRRNDNDIIIDDPSVSASHAWLINQHGHYVLMNTLSTNGTFVNDKRIHEVVLNHGDHVRLGQAEFTFLTRENGGRGSRYLMWGVVTLAAILLLGSVAWWFLAA